MKNSSKHQVVTLSENENVLVQRIQIYLAIAVIYISFITAIIF